MKFFDSHIVTTTTNKGVVCLVEICGPSKFWAWNVGQWMEEDVVNGSVHEASEEVQGISNRYDHCRRVCLKSKHFCVPRKLERVTFRIFYS